MTRRTFVLWEAQRDLKEATRWYAKKKPPRCYRGGSCCGDGSGSLLTLAIATVATEITAAGVF